MKHVTLAVLFLCACGVPLPEDNVESRSDALLSCGAASDSSCVGKTAGSSCDDSGTCQRDGEVAGQCICVVSSPPPPPPTKCRCADGTAFGQHCASNPWLTCSGVFTGQFLSCACQ